MGGIRYSTEKNDTFINSNSRYSVPPLESLRALCDACHEIESAEERNELPERRWLDQLVDTDGRFYVAKFPSNKDLENTELSDINALRDSCESYMLDLGDASDIIDEVICVIKDWQRVATENQIPVK